MMQTERANLKHARLWEIEVSEEGQKEHTIAVGTLPEIGDAMKRSVGTSTIVSAQSTPIYIQGIHVQFEQLTNALEPIGWVGGYVYFAAFQHFFNEIHEIQNSKGLAFDNPNAKYPEQLLRMREGFSPGFWSGECPDVVILCPTCKFWADFDYQEAFTHFFYTLCPSRKLHNGSHYGTVANLIVVESTFFEDGHKQMGTWTGIQAHKGQLVKGRTRQKTEKCGDDACSACGGGCWE